MNNKELLDKIRSELNSRANNKPLAPLSIDSEVVWCSIIFQKDMNRVLNKIERGLEDE